MRDSHLPSRTEDPDDIDRLFARLERAAAPTDLTARVLAQTIAADTTRAVLAWPWIVAGLAALGLLAGAGYQLGMSLAASDGLELLAAVFGDLGLLATAPGDVVAALGEVIPRSLVALAGVSAALLILAASHAVSRVPVALRSQPTA
jgi:hypothetical protein